MFRMGESRTAARAVIGRRPLPAMAPLLLPLLCGSSALAAEPDPLVAAIYFGDWHVNPQMSAVHGPNWTEYQLPIHAGPRFPGHLQPNIPVSAAPSHTVQLSLIRHPSDPVLTALHSVAATAAAGSSGHVRPERQRERAGGDGEEDRCGDRARGRHVPIRLVREPIAI
jgi:hypothetical protein